MTENTGWQAPTWLTDSYLEEVLQKYLKDNKVKIKNVYIKPATAKGENYASVMSRIKVSYLSGNNKTAEELSFIMKYSHESDPYLANIMAGYDVYNTEMKMYEQILPQLADILKEFGDNDKLFANTLKVDYDRSTIIFEDLSVQNYTVANRLTGMNETHVLMTLNKLAKFHAAAAVLNQRLNGELEKFDHGIFNPHTREFGRIFEHLTGVCANFAESCPELGPYYHDKLIKLKEHIVDYATSAYNNNPKHFFTLCHGDLWINNMMMTYDEASADKKSFKDILLIDFQLCNWSSPAVDLYYFFNTSLEPQLIQDVHAIDKFVQYYHKHLIEVLKKLNYQGYIPTLHEFHIQMKEGEFLSLAAAVGNQPHMISDQCEDADFHSLLDDTVKARNFRNNLFKNKRLQANLKVLLPYFDRIGLMDVHK